MSAPLLSTSDRKEQLSWLYIAAVASECGFTVSVPNLDRDSQDIQIQSGTSRRASVAFQLKATSSPDWDSNDLRFQLKAKNFNDLALRRQVPLLLAVMVLPSNPTEWLSVTPDEMTMRKCVWWHSIIGESPTEQGSRQVRLPRANLLTTNALKDLIKKSEDNTL